MHTFSPINKFVKNSWQNTEQGQKNRYFLGNAILATAFSAPLFFTAKDDKVAQQTAFQDVIINSSNLFGCLKPEKPVTHLVEGFIETTVFSALVGAALAPIVEHFKSTTSDILGAISVVGAAHLVGDFAKKRLSDPEKKVAEPKPELNKDAERAKLVKTRLAVAIACAFKWNIYRNNVQQGNGHTSNAIYLSSLLNSVKTLAITEKDFRTNKELRDAKDVIGILFDGVVSPHVTKAVIHLGNKANLSNGVGMVLAKSLVGGVVASGALYAGTELLNAFFDWGYNRYKKQNNG